MLKIKFSSLLLLFSWLSISQELPPVLNFGPNDYKAGNQNWMVSKSETGNVYVANSMGLLEFNGSRWDLYPVPNNTIVRAVKAVDDRIFTGAYMEAGYWKKNACGLLDYTSLLSKFPSRIRDGEQFWHIESSGNIVIFQSFEGIYLYHLEKDKVTPLDVPAAGPISNLFRVDREIYFLVGGEGLFQIQNGRMRQLISAEILEEREIIQLYHADKDLRLITRAGEIYTFAEGMLTRINRELSEKLSGKSFFSALQLHDGSLLLGSVENGLYHLAGDGSLLEHFNQENGLQNNTVLNLFLDENNNVWAGLDNGLSILDLQSPFKLFQDHVGRIGTVYSSFKTEDYLYLGTNQGLYFRRKNEQNFNLIPGTNGQVWSLQMVDDVLFCGHNNGTYVVKGDSAIKISDRLGTWMVAAYKGLENTYVQGHYNGFSFLERKGEEFLDLPMVQDFPHSSKNIVANANGDLWISNEHKGVFRLRLDDSLRNILKIKNYVFEEGTGITSGIFEFKGDLYYSDLDEIFKYDEALDIFSLENPLFEALRDVDRISGKVVPINDKVWVFGESAIVSAGPSRLEEDFQSRAYYFPRDGRSIPLGYENLTRLEGEEYMLGLVDGYLLFNENYGNLKLNYEVKINRITRRSIDEEAVPMPLAMTKNLHYKDNNINFHFNIPEFKKFVIPLYSYRLNGLNQKWSDWTPETTASFTNLRFGNYEFEVRVKIGDEITSFDTYSFEIARPWYLSNLAIAAYVLLFLLLLFFVHYVYQKEHEKRIKENEKALKVKNLEAEQEIIKLKNEKLEKEMEGKSRELAISTMNLIKKNEFLGSIKDKLQQSEGSSEVRSVIRTIDKDISEKDNWSFFEKAFNNADKEFFKKIKARHPQLTSNDLKLCAYLRLNLTSKEIAPLLNISVKSVEIKRYRLRKKMNLPHEINLVDYILEL